MINSGIWRINKLNHHERKNWIISFWDDKWCFINSNYIFSNIIKCEEEGSFECLILNEEINVNYLSSYMLMIV